ncbi:hypothetical protein BST61_g4816 [Cercospora zeina]
MPRATSSTTCARTPQAHETLLSEIDAADRQGTLSDPVTFDEAQNLPYLQAVIREAFPHASCRWLATRKASCRPEVSKSTESGYARAHGHRREPWGHGARMRRWSMELTFTIFRPERWLEASPEKLRLMDRNDGSFGAGARDLLLN